jgi:putative glutamine amidotransferase
MRPVVGITSYAEDEVSWGAWTEAAALVPLAYVRAVERAGGRPFVIPPSDDAIEETLDVLDGIIFSGGSDLAPDLYEAEAHPETVDVREERDRAEMALLAAALERDMPVLAVCRGSQVLNVALGGDLDQHLPDSLGHDEHRPVKGEWAEHDVRLDPEGRVGRMLGERTPVKSHHHQGFGRIGKGLHVTGWADDGTVEALEDPERRFTIGVLWHPEEGEDLALFEGLVEEARRYREERA